MLCDPRLIDALLPLDAGHGILAGALLIALLLLWRSGGRIRRGNMRRGARAARAEGEAEALLRRAGYQIVDRQVTAWWALRVDGEDREVMVRADLVVRRKRRTYIAEVKTGARAPRPDLPETRRQLLEYLLAFDVHGVLLVDMERRSVHEVEFPGLLG